MGTKMRAVVVSVAALLMAASCSSERRFGVDPAQSELGLATVGTVVAPELVPTDLAPAFEVANAIGFPEGDVRLEDPDFGDDWLMIWFDTTTDHAAVSRWLTAVPALLECDDNLSLKPFDAETGRDGWLTFDCRTELGERDFYIGINGILTVGGGSFKVAVRQYE